MTGGVTGVDTAGSADTVLTTGSDGVAAVPPGGAHPGGGTKALSGSAERTGATATVADCGAGVGTTGSAAATATGIGDGVSIGPGEADAVTVGAAWPGGAQPGGGTNALLGSAARTGVASGTIGAGVATIGVGVATIGAGAGGSAVVVTTAIGGGATGVVTGVATGAADATLGAGGWPGGAQPGGGMNALLGSAGGAGGAGGAAGSGTTTGAGVAAGGVATGSATGALVIGATGAGSGAGPAGGSPAILGVPLAPSGGALLLASFSAAVRAWRCSRALASRASASFSMASFCAFWPPLAATMEPICGPVRVSSTAAMPASYWRPELLEGRLALAVTEASAPGRALALCTGVLSPNIPQPDRSANADTPTRPNHRPRPPIVCCSLCIAVTRLKPDSLMVFSGSREEI